VRTALSEGAPWSRIGDALGVSRQAAHQKHSATAYEIDRRVAVTPSARRAVRLARDEAVSRGADEVAVAHLLIGLLQVDAAAARKLAVRGLTPETVRARLEPANGNRPSPDDETHLSEQTQSVLSAAMRDAVDRGHEELLPEHLLAAVLRIL
jgi:ATP-dependent Clp protease ATP-binding subunit ClpA